MDQLFHPQPRTTAEYRAAVWADIAEMHRLNELMRAEQLEFDRLKDETAQIKAATDALKAEGEILKAQVETALAQVRSSLDALSQPA